MLDQKVCGIYFGALIFWENITVSDVLWESDCDWKIMMSKNFITFAGFGANLNQLFSFMYTDVGCDWLEQCQLIINGCSIFQM